MNNETPNEISTDYNHNNLIRIEQSLSAMMIPNALRIA